MTAILHRADAEAPAAEPAGAAYLAPGRVVLDRYRLQAIAGRGGMSVVYRAVDLATGTPVAVKVLASHLVHDPASRRRLLGEARAAARLPHPHIVRVLDAGSAGPDGADVALVMELVEGETLAKRLERGPLPVEEAVTIAAQLAEALAFAHGRGVIHRDVKPQNVLLARTAKLADFGIARSLDQTTTFTATGHIMGSAPYVAPEVLRGAPAGPASDVYALGVTLFQMLTGRRPFEGTTPAALLSRKLIEEPPRVAMLRDVPSWLDALVTQMLARDPARRPSDTGELARALRAAHTPLPGLAPVDPAAAIQPLWPARPRGAIGSGTASSLSQEERESAAAVCDKWSAPEGAIGDGPGDARVGATGAAARGADTAPQTTQLLPGPLRWTWQTKDEPPTKALDASVVPAAQRAPPAVRPAGAPASHSPSASPSAARSRAPSRAGVLRPRSSAQPGRRRVAFTVATFFLIGGLLAGAFGIGRGAEQHEAPPQASPAEHEAPAASAEPSAAATQGGSPTATTAPTPTAQAVVVSVRAGDIVPPRVAPAPPPPPVASRGKDDGEKDDKGDRDDKDDDRKGRGGGSGGSRGRGR